LVDPEDSRALAQAIARVLEVPELADSLRRKGRERVEQFSWERTARQTLETYQSVLSDDEE
jgi:glycosyltransferase involved in cell wall biosynthesis